MTTPASFRPHFEPLERPDCRPASDEPFTLPPNGGIGIIHPLELTENQRKAWQTHMADYEITPPFPQLGPCRASAC